MFVESLKNWIRETLSIEGDFSVEHPTEVSHGDYATNAALVEAKKQSKNPRELAAEYVEKLKENSLSEIQKIEIAGPGFINVFLKPEFFSNNVGEVIEKKGFYGRNEILGRKKIIIEYTNCNVLKPMHIGHLMGNVIGESLSRLLEANGAQVKRDTYQGDSGLHVAKVVWGIEKLGGKIQGALSEKVFYIGKAYALGAEGYEDDEKIKEEIHILNKKIFEKTDPALTDLYEWGRKVSLDHFEELYKKLGTKFDYYFFESEVAADALRIVDEYKSKGIFEDSDGAVIFRGEQFDPKLHTRVFVNRQGIPMYDAKDIAHALRKYDTFVSDQSIVVTANEQNEYFKVVLCALAQVSPDIARQTVHFSHGLLKLPDGKMSSRKGNVITGESLISDVQDMALAKMAERDFSEEEKKSIAEIIAVAAIKYSILRQAPGKDIIFDFDTSLSFDGDSGPYLQYSYVRAESIVRKSQEAQIDISPKMPDSWQVTLLEKQLARFAEVVKDAGENFAPQHIATYLIELASSFNSFYAEQTIVDAADPSSPYKVALTQAFAQVMKNGLYLLGIAVPEKM